jgi:hypothetical protein
VQPATPSSYAGQLIYQLRWAAREMYGDASTAQTQELAAELNNGPLAARVSVHVVDRLLTAPHGSHWLFLSYERTESSAVVIGDDPHECSWLHKRVPIHDRAPSNYKRSVLATEVIKNLVTTLLGTADYAGGEATAILVSLHVLGLITLSAEALQTYAKHPDQPLRMLRARSDNGADRAIRSAYMAVRYVIDNPTNLTLTLSGELSDAAVDAVHDSLGVIARAVAAGFVHLSELDRYRSPDKHNPGFIDKPALLKRLLLPSRHMPVDVTQREREAMAMSI